MNLFFFLLTLALLPSRRVHNVAQCRRSANTYKYIVIALTSRNSITADDRARTKHKVANDITTVQCIL